MDKVQDTLNELNGNKITLEEVKRCLRRRNILIKCTAIIATVRLNIFDDETIMLLSIIAQNICNESHVIGLWNSGHFALAALKLLNTATSREKYKQIYSNLQISQKKDIDRLLTDWLEDLKKSEIY